MNQFKEGDKVEVIKLEDNDSDNYYLNEVFTINEIWHNSYIWCCNKVSSQKGIMTRCLKPYPYKITNWKERIGGSNGI